MIKLTRLNDKIIYQNPDLIDSVETHPDTTITLTNGNKFSVKEKPEQIIQEIIDFRAKIISEANKVENL